MMKKIRLAFAVALVSFSAAAAPMAGVPAFRVTAPNGESSLLIGTMHVPHPALLQPSGVILHGMRTFVMEHTTHDERPDGLDPEACAGLLESRNVRAPWARGITEKQISLIVERYNCAAEKPLTRADAELLLKLRTARLMSMLAFIPCTPPGMLSRDDLLAKAAAQYHVPVTTLESQQEVSARRSVLPEHFYENSLEYALNTDLDKLYQSLVAAFNRGDFSYIEAHAADGLGNAADRALFQNTMLVERNLAWMPTLRNALDKGKAVVAVGAGHLGGRQGLPALLTQAGYLVEPVTLPAAN